MATIDDMTDEEWVQLSNDRYADAHLPSISIRLFFNFKDLSASRVFTHLREKLMKRFPSGRFVNIDKTLTFLIDVPHDEIDLIFDKRIPIAIASIIDRIQITDQGRGTQCVLKPSFANVEQYKNYCERSIGWMLLFGDNPCIPSWCVLSRKGIYGPIRAIAASFLFQPVIVDKSCKKESIEEWNSSRTNYVIDCCTNKTVEDINKELTYGEVNYGNECYRCIVKEFDSEASYVLHIRCCYYNETLYSSTFSTFSTMPSKVFAYITPNQ